MRSTDNHLPSSPTTSPPLSRSVSNILVPSRRALIISLFWVVWFVASLSIQLDVGGRLLLLDQSSGQRQQQAKKLIEGKLLRHLPVHGLHADGTPVEYRCHVGELIFKPKAYRLWGGLNGTRRPLPPPLDATGVLDFAAHISRNELRVLIVGNSLGEQLAAGLEEAMCLPLQRRPDRRMTSSLLPRSDGRSSSLNGRTVSLGAKQQQQQQRTNNCQTKFAENYNYTWMKDPRIVVTTSSSQDGGGGSGLLGVIKDNTDMMDTKTKWKRNHTAISNLLEVLTEINSRGNNNSSSSSSSGDVIGENNYSNNTAMIPDAAAAAANETNSNHKKQQLLDVLIYQFQSGHVDLNDFDEYYLEQAIEVASELFGATSVIFPTISWMNNVNDASRVEKLEEVNDRIRGFAQRYNNAATTSASSSSSVESVQVADFAKLMQSYIEINARDVLHIPEEEIYTLRVTSRWESLVAHLCASLPFEHDPRGCLPGMVSLDGMHVCPETLHGRMNAVIVCLLDCKFNRQYHRRHHPTSQQQQQRLLDCSDGCNSKYMNLRPLSFSYNEHLEEEISLTS